MAKILPMQLCFFKLNNALKEEGEEITFDPCLLVLDEKACNWNAIISIYGQQIEERMVSWSSTLNKV